MAGNSGGPWGGGGQGGDDRGPKKNEGGGRRPANDGLQMPPEIDDMLKKGQDQLRVLMGGKGGGGRGGDGDQGDGPNMGRTVIIAFVALFALFWTWSSLYRVQQGEQSVEFFFGKYTSTNDSGLNFAPWPLYSYVVVPVTRQQTEAIGVGGRRSEAGLMLTRDENIVDIDFEVVWNINDPAKYLFNLRDPQMTVRAVAESSMRQIIAQSDLAPILNTDRETVADDLEILIQQTLDSYNSGVNLERVNLDRVDPPEQVIDSVRAVQAAEQERDRLEKQADAYANRVLAQARGESAQLLEEAEGYRASVINGATGEASRFSAVLAEYIKAPEVTRKRLYIETMEAVLGSVDKVIIDQQASGQGVVPYLPLNQLRQENK
ncbi:FtsH protease activity modulator HflK [Rhodobacteraceae bacterium Araon29]